MEGIHRIQIPDIEDLGLGGNRLVSLKELRKAIWKNLLNFWFCSHFAMYMTAMSPEFKADEMHLSSIKEITVSMYVSSRQCHAQTGTEQTRVPQ